MRAPSVVAHRPRSRSREPARRGASGSGAVRAGRSVGRSVVAWRGVAWRAVSECRGRSGGGPQPASAGRRAPRRRRSCGVGRLGDVPGGGADRPDRGPLRAERRGGLRRQDPAPPLPTPPARPPARSGARRSLPRRRRVLRPPTRHYPMGRIAPAIGIEPSHYSGEKPTFARARMLARRLLRWSAWKGNQPRASGKPGAATERAFSRTFFDVPDLESPRQREGDEVQAQGSNGGPARGNAHRNVQLRGRSKAARSPPATAKDEAARGSVKRTLATAGA